MYRVKSAGAPYPATCQGSKVGIGDYERQAGDNDSITGKESLKKPEELAFINSLNSMGLVNVEGRGCQMELGVCGVNHLRFRRSRREVISEFSIKTSQLLFSGLF